MPDALPRIKRVVESVVIPGDSPAKKKGRSTLLTNTPQLRHPVLPREVLSRQKLVNYSLDTKEEVMFERF
jgi:hypothetical protein